jgi:hypothetical protein
MSSKQNWPLGGVDAAQELVVKEGELASVKELAFAFQRAASRLTEVSWGLGVWWGRGPHM